MRIRSTLALLAWLACAATAHAQISTSITFTNGTTANADDVNTVISELASAALNRTGGTITGNVVMASGLTIGGVNIAGALCPTCTPSFAGLTVTGTGAGAITDGGGLTAGSGAVAIIGTDGRIPAISSTYFASLSGANLTGLNAANLSSGQVAVANGGTGQNLSAVTEGSILYFSGTGTMATLAHGSGGFLFSNGALPPLWTTVGTAMTDLNAANLTVGTVPSSAIAGTYANTITFSNVVTFTDGSSVFEGIHESSDGSAGITSSTCNFTSGAPVIKNGLIISGPAC